MWYYLKVYWITSYKNIHIYIHIYILNPNIKIIDNINRRIVNYTVRSTFHQLFKIRIKEKQKLTCKSYNCFPFVVLLIRVAYAYNLFKIVCELQVTENNRDQIVATKNYELFSFTLFLCRNINHKTVKEHFENKQFFPCQFFFFFCSHWTQESLKR